MIRSGAEQVFARQKHDAEGGVAVLKLTSPEGQHRKPARLPSPYGLLGRELGQSSCSSSPASCARQQPSLCLTPELGQLLLLALGNERFDLVADLKKRLTTWGGNVRLSGADISRIGLERGTKGSAGSPPRSPAKSEQEAKYRRPPLIAPASRNGARLFDRAARRVRSCSGRTRPPM